MGITCVVYIDDTVLLLTEDLSWEQLDLAETYYELCGFEMSSGKREVGMEEAMIKSLGYEYTRGSGFYTVRVPEKKKDEFCSLLHKIRCDFGRKAVDIKDFEKLAGKGCFLSSLEPRPDQWAIRSISHWTTKANFFAAMNAGKKGLIIKGLEWAEKAVKAIEPMLICNDSILCETINLVTDAASPEDPTMGGFNTGAATQRKAWSMDWKEQMGEVRFWKQISTKESHIGIWELMAVLLNLMFRKEAVAGKKVYFFVDNAGDVRILVKGTANCEICQAIVWVILELLSVYNVKSSYSLYINTLVNPADLLTRLSLKRLEKLRKFHTTVPGVKIDNSNRI
jgi:hypothetical protein